MHDTALHLQSRLQNEYGFFYYVESEGALGTSWSTPDYAYVRGNEYIYSNSIPGLTRRASLDLVMTS